MIELRPYQATDLERLRREYGLGARAPLYVLPTGGGKTVLFSELIRRAVARGGRILLLVHRQELIRQASKALGRLGVDHGVIAPRYRPTDAPVQIASVQTIVRRLGRYEADAFTLIVVDEAHHAVAGTWSRVLSHFSGAKRLGVTATPIRLDGRGLASSFDRLVVGPSAAELVEAGHLAEARVFAPPIGFSRDSTRRRMGEYDLDQAEEQITTVRAMGETVSHYRRLLDGQTAIAFCCSVKHAEAVAEEFERSGVPAASIDGTMSAELREDRLERLSRGELRVLTSCMLIGEGVDVPSVAGCILLRPTKSLSLFLQMIGRCLRPAEGKAAAVVLDHVGNYAEHGHHLEDRDWSLEEGLRKRAKKDEAESLWVCPSCYCNVPSRLPDCPECGKPKPVQKRSLAIVPGDLVEVERHHASMRREAATERDEKRREQGNARTYEELCHLGRTRGMRNPGAWAANVLAARRRRSPYRV